GLFNLGGGSTMAKQVLKLDRRLGEIFMRESFKSFTILKLREAYVKDLENRDQLDLVEVRRYLYKQILRLKKRGLLRGRAGSNGRTAQYFLEDSFGSAPLRLVSGPYDVGVQTP